MKFVRLVLFLHLSPRVQKGGEGENMVLNAVEAVPAGSELPAADNSMRTSMGGRYGVDALAPLLTRALPMHFSGARGSAIIPKLVKLVGLSTTLEIEVFPFFTRPRVLMSDSIFDELHAEVLLDAGWSLSSLPQVHSTCILSVEMV